MRLGLQLTIRQTNVPQSGYPLTVNVSPMQAESFHGSHARVKTFLEMLAAFLQAPFFSFGRLQKFCKLRFLLLGLCRSSASSDFSFLVFAEVLQAPFFPFGHLQESCKLHFLLLGVCRSPASSDFSFLVFAEVLQAPFSPFGRLQNFCKRPKAFRETCNSVANVSKNTLTVIARYPRHSPEIRNLILSSNSSSVRTSDFKEASARKSFLLLLRAQGPQGLYVFM